MTESPSNGSTPKPTPDNIKALNEIKRTLEDVSGLLRTQRDMLRQRGMNLPDRSMKNIRTLRKSFDSLGVAVVDGYQELHSLRALADMTAVINSSQNTDEVLNQVMDKAIELTGADRGYIMLQNKITGELEVRVDRGLDQKALAQNKDAVVSTTVVRNVVETGQPVLTDNASEDKRYVGQDSVVGYQLRSILAVPLNSRGQTIGAVYLDNRFMSGVFKQHELEVLTAFANQAAVAIENAQLFEMARQRVTEMTDIRDRMDNLFKSIASGVITIDDNMKVLVSNEVARQLLGQAEVLNCTVQEVMPVMDDNFYAALNRVMTKGTQEHIECTPIIGGTEHVWHILASPLQGEQGVAMVIDDLTEQRKSESQITEVRRYLPLALVENMRSVDISDVSGQEREITALFADVRGFTTFSENLEPEELMQVINKYLSLASDSINLFEGIVEKYLGDAVTGLFNTQLNPQPDHARRAIQTALQLVLDLLAQHEVLPDSEQLFYGIGIHTGPAVLGNMGGQSRKEFTALGEAMNICKYLQEQAGPGEIVISEATYRYVEDQFECVPLTEIARPKKDYAHVKGYIVKGRKEGALSPFIDDELLALLGELNDEE